MRKIFSVIIFLKSLATGIIVPVLALMLMTRGSSMQLLSVLLGLYSFTVIIVEFPSGIMADVFGRKKVFLFSVLMYLVSFVVLLFSRSFLTLAAAMILYGIGRAFSTGSIDALIIDASIEEGNSVENITTHISVMENIGLALGALIGGGLADIMVNYSGNIIVCLGLYGVLLLLGALVAESKESSGKEKGISDKTRIGRQIKSSFVFVGRKRSIQALFLFSFISGLALAMLEIYWQPALAELQSPSWLLGCIVFAGFAGSTVGGKLSQGIITGRPAAVWRILLVQKAIVGVSLILLALCFQIYNFVGMFLVFYLFLGAGSITENTILNKELNASSRASVISLFSFVMQLGGLAAALCGWAFVLYLGYRGLWILGGGLLTAGAAGFILVNILAGKRKNIAESK